MSEMAGELNSVGGSGIWVQGLHKTGTMFLYRFFKDLSERLGYRYFSVNNRPPNDDELGREIGENFCVCPVRSIGPVSKSDYPNLRTVTQLVQIRDPRDILVSQYYSFGFIHCETFWSERQKAARAETRDMGIDAYAVSRADTDPHFTQGKGLLARYEPVLRLVASASSDVRILRYEDMILAFDDWIRTAIAPFGIDNAERLARHLHRDHRSEFATKGETMTHKRKIVPGDYKEKLKTETIAVLNDKFAPILETFYRDLT